jgi:hypothetical protein
VAILLIENKQELFAPALCLLASFASDIARCENFEKGEAPKSRQPDQSINDPANRSTWSVEYARDHIDLKKAPHPPVQRSDNH